MDRISIIGGNPLKGTIRISGAKNAALPLMTASLLTDQPLTLTNLPELHDIETLAQVLEHMGVSLTHVPSSHEIILKADDIHDKEAPYDLVRKMRASILVLGPLVARTGYARVSLPGGCAIGTRPIDFHIKGLEQMGAEIELEAGYVTARAPKGLKGADITFPLVSVTGTENLMMAAVLAKGVTRLINAAQEPEVTDLAHCLIKMGAKITGLDSTTLIIEGVDSLKAATHSILPDRIETGTYIMAAGITGGSLLLTHTDPTLIPTVLPVLMQAGIKITTTKDTIHAEHTGRLGPVDITTEPYPGYATDLQAQIMALMTIADGASIIRETIFENRFMHVPELNRMGADIQVKGNTALVRGKKFLKGAPVMATDLRASVSLVLAGLAAQGETVVSRVYHLDRGYEKVEHKLRACGAQIERIQGEASDDRTYAS
ncbi:UDP-N-acetylglucosamine 1-carboxyvinyltransferase [Candidatus Nucleicultrix amoebiphila]|uniref:UDP-N-acetylglucosamine 1-carboxyvinyltransferase n=1 Tax=Candidatus Nucleicultrix amoebiphila FS5 TaxID=1414854 RepID=A0A1W6N2L4_9PROT|nr:UDP-N-acetylglucosamine 1-carboxyvinyltransferase [Candidatus Nucleicultrix amoebiphila]ARN84082.1 UDP-N-acetylglucosamine 1-carboxyvinyltransferase [Candidatus Nucleicultrix amoebiphila FS5]